MRELIVKYRRPLVVAVHLSLWTLALVLAIATTVGIAVVVAWPRLFGI